MSVKRVMRTHFTGSLTSLSIWGTSGSVGSFQIGSGIKPELAENNLANSFPFYLELVIIKPSSSVVREGELQLLLLFTFLASVQNAILTLGHVKTLSRKFSLNFSLVLLTVTLHLSRASSSASLFRGLGFRKKFLFPLILYLRAKLHFLVNRGLSFDLHILYVSLHLKLYYIGDIMASITDILGKASCIQWKGIDRNWKSPQSAGIQCYTLLEDSLVPSK